MVHFRCGSDLPAATSGGHFMHHLLVSGLCVLGIGRNVLSQSASKLTPRQFEMAGTLLKTNERAKASVLFGLREHTFYLFNPSVHV